MLGVGQAVSFGPMCGICGASGRVTLGGCKRESLKRELDMYSYGGIDAYDLENF